MHKIMKALHDQNMELNKKYKFYHENHCEFCQKFDELSENNGSKEDFQRLCLELIDAFSDLYFIDN